MGVVGRLKHAWNVFTDADVPNPTTVSGLFDARSTYGSRPDRVKLSVSNERSMLTSVLNRISMDVAAVDIRHVRVDDQDRYVENIRSGLYNCLDIEANIDQGARHFRQDIALTLFDQGAIAIVPIDTTLNPIETGGYDIQTMRVGKIVDWKPNGSPRHVKVEVYNDRTGNRESVIIPKSMTAIVENPLYAVMNEPSSTLQRLIAKLNMLDAVDQASSSGKLDLIVQLPYVVKTETRKHQAEQRRSDLEAQLSGSKYGIAYTDGTEKITQLNRPVENNLMGQIEYLVDLLYSQLGITKEVMNGTANEAAMLNYNNRTVEPVVGAIAEAMQRAFLTKTARSQGQRMMYFLDPFKLVPMADLAELADKFTRNEIVTSNEFRGFIGLKPSADPKADELRNSNMPVSDTGAAPAEDPTVSPEGDASDPAAEMNDAFDSIDAALDGVFADLGVPADG